MIPVYRSLAEIPPSFGPTVAAIGNFDGVHCGHRQILRAVVTEARRRSLRAIAVTFDPHPEHFLHPGSAPKMITPNDERLVLLAETGIDAVVVLKFDESLVQLSARKFVEDVLVSGLQVHGLHQGSNFRFGYRAQAGVSELDEFGHEFGFTLTVHEPVCVHRLEVSSSAVRELVGIGDLKSARWMLGRPFVVRSTPVRDRGVGSKLVVPTINLAPYEGLLPAPGVYITRLSIDSRSFQAVTNAGNRPTFEGAGFSVETHILNFEPIELTSETPLELEFLFRLRPEIKFPSPQELKLQIMRDVARAQRYFRLVERISSAN
jgi:riboflavin kinase/FMN adenylyltransferase